MGNDRIQIKYNAVIKYNGVYYVPNTLDAKKKFDFQSFDIDLDDDFVTKNIEKNKELRRLIGKQIQEKTGFSNSQYTSQSIYRVVSLYKRKKFQPHRIAIFCCDRLEESRKQRYIPYCKSIQEQCSDEVNKVMKWLKGSKIWAPAIMYFLYFIAFFAFAWAPNGAIVDLDVVAFFFVVINYVLLAFKSTKMYSRVFLGKPRIVRSVVWSDCLLEMALFVLSLLVALLFKDIHFDEAVLSRLGLSFIFLDALIRLIQMDQ